MPDLDAIRARLARYGRSIAEMYESSRVPSDVREHYVRDVAALLAALDAKVQKEAGER